MVGKVKHNKHGLIICKTFVNELLVHDVNIFKLAVFQSLKRKSYLAET